MASEFSGCGRIGAGHGGGVVIDQMINEVLPKVVRGTWSNYPHVGIVGDGWSVSVFGPWRGVNPLGEWHWDQDFGSLDGWLSGLVGSTFTRCASSDEAMVLEFDEGRVEVTLSSDGYESLVLRAEELPVVVVL